MKIKMCQLLAIFLLFSNIAFIILYFHEKGGIDYFRKKLGLNQHITYREPKLDYVLLSKLYMAMPRIPNSIVFAGNSLMRDCDWAEMFQNPGIRNRGIGGDCAEGVRKRMAEILDPPPSKIFFEIGISDLARGYRAEEMLQHYQAIIDTARKVAPDAKIFIHSVLPVRKGTPARHYYTNSDIVTLNTKLKAFAQKNKCTYIDLHPLFLGQNGEIKPELTRDGVHLTNEGYQIWKAFIKEMVEPTSVTFQH